MKLPKGFLPIAQRSANSLAKIISPQKLQEITTKAEAGDSAYRKALAAIKKVLPENWDRLVPEAQREIMTNPAMRALAEKRVKKIHGEFSSTCPS